MTVVKLADRDDAYRDEVVERLEKLLAAARKGEIISIVYACERPSNIVTYGSTHIKDRYVMLGHLIHACFLTSKSLDDDATEETLIGDG